ncbi:MAG: hypothetical protein HUJ61_00010, partial [Bacilli bacterium]|nr:hypothetical protein [Bacilli bacterium]
MSVKNDLKELREIVKKAKAVSHVLSIANFDHETIAPLKGASERSESFAYVDNIIFELTTSDEYKRLVYSLHDHLDEMDAYDRKFVNDAYDELVKVKNIKG